MKLNTKEKIMKARREYVSVMLEKINNDPAIITDYAGDAVLKGIFENAFDPELKWSLPEGEPPFKPTDEPMGMTPTNLFQEIRRFYIFRREDLNNLRRESLFIELIEGVHPEEAKILVAVKDQTLTGLYPNITADVVAKGGFISEEVASRFQPQKKGRGRPPKVASDSSEVAKEPKKRGRPPKSVELPA